MRVCSIINIYYIIISFVLHVASPFPIEVPKNENDIIKPAVQGTINVLRAALKNNVKRVVLTSSIAAVLPTNV